MVARKSVGRSFQQKLDDKAARKLYREVMGISRWRPLSSQEVENAYALYIEVRLANALEKVGVDVCD